MRLVNWRTLVASAASIALAACGDDVTVVQPIPGLTLNPASVSCTAGTSTAVGVTVTGATGTPTVTFTGSGSGFTVTGSGTGATVACTTAGSGVINVAVTANGQTVTGSIPVTVNAAQPPIQAVSVSPTQATIAVGATTQLTPTVIAATTGANTAVTYTSLQTNIATVDANGVVRGVAPGTATIRVASVASPSIVATAVITVVPTSAFVQSLTVQPSNVTLQTGATQTVASTVTLAPGAPAGTSQGVTYTSSDTSVVRVSATGVITAVRNGTAVVTVASVAAPGVTQAISVTVRDPAPVRLTIQGVNVLTATGTQPADLNNVAGNLFVNLNLDPGDFRPDSVRLRLGSQTVNCQRFTAALAAAYREALTTGAADVQQITCQLNTAQFDTLTGIARVQNGAQPLTAEVFFRPQGAAAGTQTQRAEIPLQLTVNNVSGFFARIQNVLPAGDSRAAINATGRALGPDGRTWLAGDLRITVLPVLFQSAGAVAPLSDVTVTLQDANLPGGSATQTSSAAGNAGGITVTFPGAMADQPQGGNSVSGFTSTPTGTTICIGSVGGNSGLNTGCGGVIGGAVFLNASGTAIAVPVVNIDNQTPEQRLVTVPAQFTQGNQGNLGFLSGGFNFADSLTFAAVAGQTFTGNGDNNGVDRVTRRFFVGQATDASNTNIIATGTRATTGNDLTNFSGVAITNNALRAVAVLADALGNSRNVNVFNTAGTANFTFGVDLVAPSITGGTSSGIDRSGATLAGSRTATFSVSDDVSGFNTLPLVGRITRQDPAIGLVCVSPVAPGAGIQQLTTGIVAAGLVTTATTSIANCPLVALPLTFGVDVSAGRGEYRIDAAARDVAGNLSAFSTRRFVIDPSQPAIGGISIPATLGGNAVATFTSSAADDFDLQSAYGLVAYAGNTGVVLRYDGPTLGTSFDNVFTTSAPITLTTTNGFIRSITVGPANIGTAAVGAASATILTGGNAPNVATAVGLIAIDAGNNRALGVATLPASNLGTVPATIVGPGSERLIDSVRVQLVDPAGNASGSNNGGIISDTLSTSGTTGTFGALNPTSVSVRYDVFGPSGTFNIPFQRVELWTVAPNTLFSGNDAAARAAFNPAQPLAAPFTSTAYRFFQAFSGAPSITDLGGTVRRVRYTTTVNASAFDPGSSTGRATGSFVVVGVTANGDAVVSAPVQIVVNNP